MRAADLIKLFEVRESVPVDVDDVVEALKNNGIKDEIYFWEANLNDEALRGTISYWSYPKDKKENFVADIYFATSLTLDWQRLVCCKELIHILDPENSRARTPAEVKQLIAKIVLSPDLQDPMKDGLPTLTDRAAIYQALAILFPWATREILRRPLIDGKLTVEDIARIVDLPTRYVRVVMSDIWTANYEIIKRL